MRLESIDLAKLITIIAEEVRAASEKPMARCACHSVNEDCCPSHLQGVIDAGEKLAARQVVEVIVTGIHGAGSRQLRLMTSSRLSRRFATMVQAANSGGGRVAFGLDSPLASTCRASST